MTELEHDQDQWAGFPRLPDPLAGQPVPSVDGPAAQDLLVQVLGPEGGSSGNRARRALARPWSIAAAVVALMVVGSTLLSGGGPAVAEPLLVAMDRTAALDSGRVEIEQTTSLGDASVTDRTTVRYRGGDEELVVSPDQSGSLPVPSGTIGTMTPVRMELRTVGGQNYVRVDLGTGLQPWASVELMGPQ